MKKCIVSGFLASFVAYMMHYVDCRCCGTLNVGYFLGLPKLFIYD